MRITGGCLLWGLALLGCSNTSTIESADTSCFSLCLGAAGEAQVSAQLEAHLVLSGAVTSASGVLTASVDGVRSLSSVVDRLKEGDVSLPTGFSYQGQGRYRISGDDGASAEIVFYLPRDTSFAQAGDAIAYNLWDTESYFKGLSVSSSVSVGLDGISTDFEFGFSEPGPLAELLGLEPNPKSPVAIDTSAMSQALMEVRVEPSVFVTQDTETTELRLAASLPQVAASALSESDLALEVTDFAISRPGVGQTLTLSDSNLTWINADPGVTGDIGFSSVSADFSFDGRLHFDAGAEVEAAFGCPGDTLSLSGD